MVCYAMDNERTGNGTPHCHLGTEPPAHIILLQSYCIAAFTACEEQLHSAQTRLEATRRQVRRDMG